MTNSYQNGLKNQEDRLQQIIREKLYPADSFPETLFPDIVNILMDVFRSSVKSENEPFKTLQKTRSIQQIAEETVNLKNLLKYHPHAIIRIYHHLIKKYVYGKHRIVSEREDVIQEIITRLLSDKIGKIQKHYNFNLKKKPSFTSYFMVIVRNIYVDIFRENNMRILSTVNYQEPQPNETNQKSIPPSASVFLEEEYSKLYYIFKMFHRLQARMELILKIKNRIPVRPDDVKRCFPGSSNQTISLLTQDFRFKNDKYVFELIAPVFNLLEKKKHKGDTLRKWISIKIDQIISHLNHTHQHFIYNNENIGDFFRLYYQHSEKTGEQGNDNP